MNISSFFKTLNYKIEQYNKVAQNPFINRQNTIYIWVEEICETKNEENE